MKKTLLVAALALGGITVARAGWQVHIGIGVSMPAPVVVTPAPVYVAPTAVYAPKPAYVTPQYVCAPAPIYVAPASIYCPPPVYVAPRPCAPAIRSAPWTPYVPPYSHGHRAPGYGHGYGRGPWR